MDARALTLLPLAALVAACHSLPDASPEPMGEPTELGDACATEPVWSGSLADGIAPNIAGFDQYGEPIDLYRDLCDRHVVIVRAGFD